MNTFLEGFTSHISNKDHGFHLVDKNLEITRFCSFKDLLKRSLSIADTLKKRGLKKDDYAILMYTPGIEFIASLLAVQIVGAIPIPTYPPFSKAGFLRLLSIKSKLNIKHTLVDGQINKLILVQSTLKNQFHYFFMKALHKDPSLDSENSGYFSNLSVINTDDILTKEENIIDFKVEDQDIALIQFTSGSVSEPKGVMLTFDNIMSNIKAIHNRMKINKDSRIFAWVPQYHDMGLVAGVLTSLYTGCNLYIMSPFDFIKRPSLWLKALDKFRITHTGGPNFSYDLCVKKITEEEMNPLDLSCLQVLINGAEPVKHSTMKNFIDKFSPCGLKPTALVPAYGMAEASLLVTSNNDHNPLGISFDKESLKTNVLKLNSSEDSIFLVSNGKVVDEHDVVIWNEEKKSLCDDLEIGEILISGNSVTSGYINSPESP
jgi:acyl-CoA synthetase (AMP-forming)/AMP-acid ligase II